MKKIVLTGGGTAGHVTPNIALVPKLKESGFEIKYIGTYNGMEKQLVEDAGLDYIGISSGKLRRYFSWKNFSDPFRDLLISLQLRSLQRYVITSLKLLHILVLRQYIQVHLSVRNYLKVIRLQHLICVVSLLTNL